MDVDWQKLGQDEKLKYLLRSGHHADVFFVVGEAPDDINTFACHKWVLQCASPVFERMFHGDFKESNSSRIHVKDVISTDFERFLEFIYCNNKEVLKIYSLDCLKGLITLGDRYMVESVKVAAIDTVEGKILNCDIGDLIAIFEFGQLISEPKLVHQAVNMIRKHLHSIAACSRIYELNAQTFYFLLDMLPTLLDKQRFDLIETYAKVNGLLDEDVEEVQPTVVLAHPSTQIHPNHSTVLPKETDAEISTDSKASKEGNQSNAGLLDAGEKEQPIVVLTNPPTQLNSNQSAVVLKNTDGKKSIDNKAAKEDKGDGDGKELEGHTVARKGDVVSMLLLLVNFYNMSAKDFCNGPAKSQLLDTATKLEILMGICTQ